MKVGNDVLYTGFRLAPNKWMTLNSVMTADARYFCASFLFPLSSVCCQWRQIIPAETSSDNVLFHRLRPVSAKTTSAEHLYRNMTAQSFAENVKSLLPARQLWVRIRFFIGVCSCVSQSGCVSVCPRNKKTKQTSAQTDVTCWYSVNQKNVRSSMLYDFATVRRRIMRFVPKCSANIAVHHSMPNLCQ